MMIGTRARFIIDPFQSLKIRFSGYSYFLISFNVCIMNLFIFRKIQGLRVHNLSLSMTFPRHSTYRPFTYPQILSYISHRDLHEIFISSISEGYKILFPPNSFFLIFFHPTDVRGLCILGIFSYKSYLIVTRPPDHPCFPIFISRQSHI